jgi:NitT/TauT family transport system substrate-binding protein
MRKPLNFIIYYLWVVPLLVGILAACKGTPKSSEVLTPLTVQLKWVHDAQFGGFYAADLQRYNADEGLAVTFIPGGTGVDVLGSVEDGKAQFGVAGAVELITARAGGKPLRAIATTYRRNPTVFFALASSGITRPQDFIGRQIRAVSDQPLVLHAMMYRVGIRPDQYTEVNLPSDLALFTSGEVPIWGAYLTSLVLIAQQAGYQVNIIYPDDYGVHLYGDTIFATDEYIAQNPDLVLRFLSATLKGWTYAVENPTEIGALVVHYNPEADPTLEIAKMTASIPLVNTGDDHIGWMKPEIWVDMQKMLLEEGVLNAPMNVTQVYTMQFLEGIYQ